MYLQPSNIYYSQDSICAYFDKRCMYSHKRIGETLDDICEGRCSIDDIPKIKVCHKNGKWITADNRRLWIFRHLERLGKCSTIYVMQTYYIPDAKMTASGNGDYVEVRGNPGGYWRNRSSNYHEPTYTVFGQQAYTPVSSRDIHVYEYTRQPSVRQESSYTHHGSSRSSSYEYNQQQKTKNDDSGWWCTIL